MWFFWLEGEHAKAIGICSWPVSVPAFPVTLLQSPGSCHLLCEAPGAFLKIIAPALFLAPTALNPETGWL